MHPLKCLFFGLAALGSVLSTLLVADEVQAAPNLLVNPGFEEARQWQGALIPADWFVTSWETPADEDDVNLFVGGGVATNVAHSGRNSLKLIIGEQEWYKVGNTTVYVMSQYKSKNVLNLAVGKTLDFNFWYFRRDMSARGDFLVQFHKTGTNEKINNPIASGARVIFSNDNVATPDGPSAVVTHGDDGWSRVVVKGIPIPAGYKTAMVLQRLDNGKPGQYLYIDDMSLEVGDGPAAVAPTVPQDPVAPRVAQSVKIAGVNSKKIIYYGWSSPDTKYLRENSQEIEQLGLDGVAFKIAIDPAKPTSGDGATENQLGWHTFGPRAFKTEEFRHAIEDLKVATAKNPKLQLFPAAAIASRDQDRRLTWFDDARWETIANNWGVLATIAKKGGCKGIFFDPEHYDYRPELFSYVHHKADRLDRPFAEYEAKARQRGRELMQASKTVFPDMTMFCMYAYDIAWLEHKTGKPLEENRLGLLPAFLDGMMEVADPRTKWVDAWEFAYAYKERAQYWEAYHTVLNKIPVLASQPSLYRAKMRVGFGLMIDYIYGPDGVRPWDTTDFSKNHFTPAEFERSLQYALETSDEYVWIYSARPGFFPVKDFPEAYRQAIKTARAAAN